MSPSPDPAALAARLRAHLDNPAYIKGWEVDRRVCVGQQRSPLRKAARDAKGASRFSDVGPEWMKAMERLQQELASAGEADFDGLLSEALSTLEAEATVPEDRVPAEAMVAAAVAAAEQHLTRGDLRKGKREYAKAQSLAALVRSAATAYAAAAAVAERARHGYAVAVDTLREELEAIGEGDFDGLLRQAIGALQAALPAQAPSRIISLPDVAPTPSTCDAAPPTASEAAKPGQEQPRATTGVQQRAASPADAKGKPSKKLRVGNKAAPAPPLAAAAAALVCAADEAPPAAAAAAPQAPPTKPAALPPKKPAPPPPKKPAAAPADAPPRDMPPLLLPLPAVPPLEVAEVDAGCVWLGTLPGALQAALLAEAFRPGARGVCGGLAGKGAGARVRGAHGAPYEPVGTTSVDWRGLGLHGCHAVPHDGGSASPAAAALLAAVRAAAPALPAATRARLAAFEPSCVRVAFETLGGRAVGGPTGAPTLCGWSTDRLRAAADDGGLKLLVLLGGAPGASVTEGFKYERRDKDRDALAVPLRPGELLLLHDEGRAWASAVTGYDDGAGRRSSDDASSAPPADKEGAGCPFDFVHLSLLDLRAFAAAKPKEHARLLAPPPPSPKEPSYRWMQCGYTVTGAAHGAAPPVIELRGRDPQQA